jgi:hypothetical protein
MKQKNQVTELTGGSETLSEQSNTIMYISRGLFDIYVLAVKLKLEVRRATTLQIFFFSEP